MMYPREECIKEIIYKLRQILFPEHFEKSCTCSDVKMLLEKQVVISLMHRETPIKSNVEKTSQEIADVFFESLHELKQILLEDAAAGFNGDPAAYSIDEIILAYPGFFATLVYRMAHILIVMDVPLIPRMMCEFAHSKTGIDIHPKAEIGRHFFIDHGTGYVTTFAGSGTAGYADGMFGILSYAGIDNSISTIPATVLFEAPTGVAVDKNGTVYVLDRGNNVVRKIETE